MINKNIGILYYNNTKYFDNYYHLIKSVSHFSKEKFIVYDMFYYNVNKKIYGNTKLGYFEFGKVIKKFELKELNNIDLKKFKNIIEDILIFQ